MTQRYMLDTNIVSPIMQGRDAELLARLSQIPVGQAVMSSVTLAELEYGLHRKGQPERLKNALVPGAAARRRAFLGRGCRTLLRAAYAAHSKLWTLT